MKIFHPFWRVVSHPTDNQRNSQVREEKWELLNDRSHFIYKAISDKSVLELWATTFLNHKAIFTDILNYHDDRLYRKIIKAPWFNVWPKRNVSWYRCVNLSTKLSSLFISLEVKWFEVIAGIKITSIGRLLLESTWRSLQLLFSKD